MKTTAVFFISLYLIIGCLASDKYPQKTLECYSFLTKPDKKLICPEARNKFCVKETSDMDSNVCGDSQYFGDEYVKGVCQFKKCAATCEEGSQQFTYNYLTYTRSTYCCTKDLCNSASKTALASAGLLVVALVVGLLI